MLKISVMSGKLKGIRALNTNPLTNPFCNMMAQDEGTVCSRCYSRKMLSTFRKNCVPVFDHNGRVLSGMMEVVPKVRDKVFRISAHGEVAGERQVRNIMRFVMANPKTMFSWYTKKGVLLNRWMSRHAKPGNLIMIYSNPTPDTHVSVPVRFDKVFNVWTKENKLINCGGKRCVDCMLCYSHNRVKQIHEVMK